ncbi:MAG: hypothetical protein PHE55_05620, partial [Methylococcaceae bacterium]|nr:hypothetical protein [Methylococcaceae bacterium]
VKSSTNGYHSMLTNLMRSYAYAWKKYFLDLVANIILFIHRHLFVFHKRIGLKMEVLQLYMLYHIGIMFWGGLFRCWYDQRALLVRCMNFDVPIKWFLVVLTAIVLCPIVPALAKYPVKLDENLLHFSGGYGIGILVFVVGSVMIRVRNSAMVWLGTISYSIYLFHPVVFYTLLWWVRMQAPPSLSVLPLGSYMAASLLLSILLSSLTFYFVEKPAMNFSRRLTLG